jgi:hypothetical protein
MKDMDYQTPRGRWDGERAQALIGCQAVVLLTFVDEAGMVLERVDRYGKIVAAEETTGVTLRLAAPGRAYDGELYRLPPDLASFRTATAGHYHLKSGEEIVDPDVVASWIVQAPPYGEDQTQTADALRVGFIPPPLEA